jgi:hypothetical protein
MTKFLKTAAFWIVAQCTSLHGPTTIFIPVAVRTGNLTTLLTKISKHLAQNISSPK